LSFYKAVGDLKIEESESEVLCIDSTALDVNHAPPEYRLKALPLQPNSQVENQENTPVRISNSRVTLKPGDFPKTTSGEVTIRPRLAVEWVGISHN
jgi:hypothetical protein